MILGEFNSSGELVFEIELVGADGEPLPVKAILDTGFTGFLAMDYQQAESLDWALTTPRRRMITARGESRFNIYEGKVVLDRQEYIVPVHGGDEIEDILLGVQWLQTKRLVVDFSAKVLTLG